MWMRAPIWEPKNTRFRPYSIGTLVTFLLGRTVGRLLRKLRAAA
jgi:hypothetical protein